MISLVLKAGHATKQVGKSWVLKPQDCVYIQCIHIAQVFNHLQRLQLCINYAALLNIPDEGTESHDEKVNDWKDALQEFTTFFKHYFNMKF